jgi:hypothetical protein
LGIYPKEHTLRRISSAFVIRFYSSKTKKLFSFCLFHGKIKAEKDTTERDFPKMDAINEKTVCYTGHRSIPESDFEELYQKLLAETERQIQKAIAGIAGKRTIIAIAHRLSTIRNADQILVIENGKVSESGTHDELVARGGSYARMHAIQSAATSSEGIA